MSMRTSFRAGPILLALAVLLSPALSSPAVAQTAAGPTPTTLASPLPSTGPGPAASIPVGGPLGLCQCISDVKNLDFTCRGSAQACQSACGQNFSFKPDAVCHSAGE